jgi:hypothetical protein
MSKLEELLVSIQSYYQTKYKMLKIYNNRNLDINHILLYDILPKKDNNSLIVLNKIDMSNSQVNLETLKFVHEGSYLIINKTKPEIVFFKFNIGP